MVSGKSKARWKRHPLEVLEQAPGGTMDLWKLLEECYGLREVYHNRRGNAGRLGVIRKNLVKSGRVEFLIDNGTATTRVALLRNSSNPTDPKKFIPT